MLVKEKKKLCQKLISSVSYGGSVVKWLGKRAYTVVALIPTWGTLE